MLRQNKGGEYMEKKTWQTIKRILNIITGVSVGCYIGGVLWVIVDYKMHPDVYASYSAPWYTPIIAASIFWGIVILIEVIALLFVRHKATAGPIIGVIERKD